MKTRQNQGHDRVAPPPREGTERVDRDRELQALQAEIQRLEGKLQEAGEELELNREDLIQGCDELGKRMILKNDELRRTNEKLQREIIERRTAVERIREQNEFLNHVLESLTYPFYVLDANDYTIKMANSAAIKGELKPGVTCYALTHHRGTPCDGIEHDCPLQLIKKTRKPVTLEHIHFDRDGNPRNVEVHGYPIFDRDGKVVQMLEYSLDITERKKLEMQLRDNAEKIKHFTYAVSHDLKSPMVGILGLIRLLHRRYCGFLDDQGKKICDQVLKSAQQMAALVDEINTYIKARETRFHFEQVDPLDLLSAVRDEFAPLLSLHRITWNCPASMPQMVMDRISMLRVFRNLVDNAVKYGGEKLSEIAVGYRDEGEYHLISVSDDGVGIKKENFEKIFEEFSRCENAGRIEGTGLGLAIVREIVAKHRGRVWVECDPPAGATFYISLPKEPEKT